MIRKLTVALIAACCLGGLTASGASATSEYFYKENLLVSGGAVSGTPHEGVYFVGAYTSDSSAFYNIAECSGGCVTLKHFQQCSGTSCTESFTPEAGFWKGYLANTSGHTVRFTAEERY